VFSLKSELLVPAPLNSSYDHSQEAGQLSAKPPRATLIKSTLIDDLLILLRKHRIKAALAALAHSRLNKSVLP
jgi:hypothetical protein